MSAEVNSEQTLDAPERVRLVKRGGIFDTHWYYPDAAIMPFDAEVEYTRVSANVVAPTVDNAPRRFDVKWQRPNTTEILECAGLTADLLAFRIRAAIRNYGHVTLLTLTPASDTPTSTVSNHVFTCAGCGRQWTVNSTDSLECFFVGLCYWCIRQHKLTRNRIDKHIHSLLVAALVPVEQSDHDEIRFALEGMIAAFDRDDYGDASIVATTRECALSVAKRAVGWSAAAPSAATGAAEGGNPKMVYSKDVMDALCATFDKFKKQTAPVSEIAFAVYRDLVAVREFELPAESVDHSALKSELDVIRGRLNQFHAEYERPIVVKDLKRLLEICDLLLAGLEVAGTPPQAP